MLKTSYCGPVGWSERQLPDGTLILTSPTGRTCTTEPKGALFFPQLAAPTGELIIPTAESRARHVHAHRKRTRAQERAARIERERGLNAARYAADPPPI